MIKLLSVAIVAGLICESHQQINMTGVTVMKNKTDVSQIVHPGLPCDYPISIRCWTEWFDMDDPSGTGDWELLTGIRNSNPGKVCPNPVDIEARTLSGLSVAAAGDVIYKKDPAIGFICRNKDQCKKKCEDYRVRFSCHPPFCGAVCWSKWYDRDNPSGTGDWELVKDHKADNPGDFPFTPLYIEAVTRDTLTPAASTGQTFYIFNPSQGFVCRNKDQKMGMCRDYKVRFAFHCD